MIASVQLQKALFKSLSEKYSVYDVVPKKANFPFISFGDFRRVENFTKTDKKRFDFLIYVHGWNKGVSSLQSKEIEEYIINKVNTIEIEGFELEICNLEMSSHTREDDVDGSTIFQTIQEFSFTINETK